MIETTELFSLLWKDLEAHCFHYFLTACRGVSQRPVRTVSFQILPKQWEQFCGLGNRFVTPSLR